MSDPTQVVAASVSIRRAGDMSKRGRRQIAAWLRKQADALIKDGDNYAPRFTARYFYPRESGEI